MIVQFHMLCSISNEAASEGGDDSNIMGVPGPVNPLYLAQLALYT